MKLVLIVLILSGLWLLIFVIKNWPRLVKIYQNNRRYKKSVLIHYPEEQGKQDSFDARFDKLMSDVDEKDLIFLSGDDEA